MQILNGRRPYIVINHLGRSKIDVNRPLKEGVEIETSNETQIVWNDYHSFIRDAIDEVDLRFGRGLLIDIHGHGHPENYIELGYVLSSEILSLSTTVLDNNIEIASESSIRALYTRMKNMISFSELLRGEYTSLGGKLQSLGYDTIPSHTHKFPMPNERYFHGGYSVQRYGSRHNEQVVDAIQIELPRFLRLGNKRLRENFSNNLSQTLMKKLYQTMHIMHIMLSSIQMLEVQDFTTIEALNIILNDRFNHHFIGFEVISGVPKKYDNQVLRIYWIHT
ncbi:T9SS type A sorting domain-containing protein [Rhizophagus irregularis DAOM 181602=DAOM 197198]|nr:T9SS type A sorting domain-containing protein [Rhizophagus irregularis DAOM 181602=DAOM 197198]